MGKNYVIREILLVTALTAAFSFCTVGCADRASNTALSAGMEALGAGDYHKAADLLGEVLKKHPENATAQANLGLALWKCGRERQAVTPLRTAATLVPDDPRPKLMLGMVLMELNLLDDARACLLEARTVAPASPAPLAALGALDIRRQKYTEAETWLQQSLRQNPDYPPALYNMGILFRTGKPDAAKSADYLRRYMVVAGQDPHAEAVRRMLDMPASGSKPQRSAVATTRESATEAKTAFALGVKHQADGKTQAAITAYKHALALNPRYAEAAYNLALLYKAEGQAAEAGAMLRQAVEAQPRMADAHYMLAVIANESGQTAETQRSLDTVLRINPDHPKAHLLSGTISLESNKPEQATAHFEKFVRLAPNDPSVPGVRLWLETHRKRSGNGGHLP